MDEHLLVMPGPLGPPGGCRDWGNHMEPGCSQWECRHCEAGSQMVWGQAGMASAAVGWEQFACTDVIGNVVEKSHIVTEDRNKLFPA